MAEQGDARPSIAIVGGGPAGLMAAEILSAAGHAVTLHDRMPSLGRKLLMAGRGGLNLTHGEPLDAFITRYGEAAAWLAPLLRRFDNQQARAWCEGLGQETFIGSSGRVFPKSLKASPLLRAWLARLAANGARVALRHEWRGFSADGALRFALPDGGETLAPASATVLALGGASWPRLGADGGWTEILRERGIAVRGLVPANAGATIAWSPAFASRFAGTPLKTVAIRFAGTTLRGDLVITAHGLEGGPVYRLNPALRGALPAALSLDLRPDGTEDAIAARLGKAMAKGRSRGDALRRLGLGPAAIALLREAASPLPAEPMPLAALVKSVPLTVSGLEPIERAISSAGGIALDELDAGLMLKRLPGVFAAGEMLDWEAPTGGYLLQASLATGRAAAEGVLAWLERRPGGC